MMSSIDRVVLALAPSRDEDYERRLTNVDGGTNASRYSDVDGRT